VIRDAVPADYAAFAVLFAELGVDDAVPGLAEWIADSMPRTIVADRGGDVVGYATFRNGHIHNLVVAPRARGEHVASALMREIAQRMRAAGIATWTLNVKAGNAPAIRLYEHLGLRPSHRARSMRVPWAIVARLPDDPCATTATPITAADDAELEDAFQITVGRLSSLRARPNRVLVQLRDGAGAPLGVAGIDPSRAGAFPFQVARPTLLRRLFEAVRAHVTADPTLDIVIERDTAAIDQLLAAGAESRLDLVNYRGAL
jgi:GNAT superfamily N-acetyltransferase